MITPEQKHQIETDARKEAALHFNEQYSKDQFQACVCCYIAAATKYIEQQEKIAGDAWDAGYDRCYFVTGINKPTKVPLTRQQYLESLKQQQ